MAAPRYIIHLGPMKTGSTYLQRCIGTTRDALLENGVYFPAELADAQSRVVHTSVLAAVRHPPQYEAVRRKFAQLNSSGYRTILLSNEFLASLGLGEIEKLRELIGAPDIRVVFFCRRWTDRIPSMCFQKIFAGGTHALPEFFVRLTGSRRSRKEFDYALVWDHWSQVFGRENLLLFPFSNFVDREQDVYQRFCQDVLEIPPMPVVTVQGSAAWASPSPAETEFLRALNALHAQLRPDRDGKPSSAMFWGWQSLRRTVDLDPLLKIIKESASTLDLNDRGGEFDAIYERMTAYADRLVGADAGGKIFTRKRREVPFISPDYLLREGIADRIRNQYHAIIAAGGGERARRAAAHADETVDAEEVHSQD